MMKILEMLFGFIPRVAKYLFPPRSDAELHDWRLGVSTSITTHWVMFAALLWFFLGSFGLVWSPFPGVAFSQEVQKVSNELKDQIEDLTVAVGRVSTELATQVDTFTKESQATRKASLAQEIWSTFEDMCDRPQGQRGAYQQRLSMLQSEYQVLNDGSNYTLPGCEDL